MGENGSEEGKGGMGGTATEEKKAKMSIFVSGMLFLPCPIFQVSMQDRIMTHECRIYMLYGYCHGPQKFPPALPFACLCYQYRASGLLFDHFTIA